MLDYLFKRKAKLKLSDSTNIEKIDKIEGIFHITGKSSSSSYSSMVYTRSIKTMKTTRGLVNKIVNSESPDSKNPSSLLHITYDKREGVAIFPRTLNQEEKEKILGSKIHYTDKRDYKLYEENRSSWNDIHEYIIETLNDSGKPFRISTITEDKYSPSI